jgi:hypothetical protein
MSGAGISERQNTFGVWGTWRAARPATRIRDVRWRWPLPSNSVLAVFEDRATALAAISGLIRAGVEFEEIWTISGVGGAMRLRETYARSGLLARLRSTIADEAEILASLEAWCERGATVLLLRAPHTPLQRIADRCVRYDARRVRATGRWVSRQVVSRPA